MTNLVGYKTTSDPYWVSLTSGTLREIMQGIRKVLSAVVLLATVVAAIPSKQCPKIQEVDWEIEVLLPHRDCDKFYQCTHGDPVEMLCPKGLFYNIIERVCEWRDRVDCGDRLIPEEEPQVTPGPDDNDSVQTVNPDFPVLEFLPNGCPVDPEVHWLLPHEHNCNLFYYCERGERDLRRCPFWLHFNRIHQVCDWPWNVSCKELGE